MDRGHPNNRRRARAIAISQSVDERRKAMVAKVVMAMASMAVVFEAVMVAHRLWAVSNP